MGTEKELPATLPITHAHSHMPLDSVLVNSSLQPTHSQPAHSQPAHSQSAHSAAISTATITTAANTTESSSELNSDHVMMGAAATMPLSDDEVGR